ncbi:hypothetical protein [Rathayibacter tritici]|uniref:Integrase n=1 Tax=Rathayibacter tritici TaxID=33888 RepID=A0A160KPA5_9MICO|nr:hypothetical protein [Rathayibacter tritici]AND15260.1 integrase [Rathayibacter tritici]PPI40984.1 hypothetical protein C5D18_14985 [Rathayibacter tritici]
MRSVSEVVAGSVPAHLQGAVAVLNAEETVWEAMLGGWRAQQFARNLAPSTVDRRRDLVTRFRVYADAYPWSWTVGAVDEFFLELRAVGGAAQSTILSYQGALRMFLEYVCDPRYGWVEQCWQRFGDHPAQVFHEWNTAGHAQNGIAQPGTLTTRLQDAGINLRAARNATLRALVLEIPAAIVADSLGYSYQIADKHRRNSGATFSNYISHRS